jgi:metal-dependent amidase/aminoacylase/carboxypeptidase family protein
MSECTKIEQKNKIIYTLDNLAPRLKQLALHIHANPELSFEEVASAAALIAPLREAGLRLRKGWGGCLLPFAPPSTAANPARLLHYWRSMTRWQTSATHVVII